MGNGLHTHRTTEIAVGVEQHIILPTFAINQGLYLIDILRLINRYDVDLYTCLVLPVGVYLVDGTELTIARFAPCSKKTNDERLAIVVEFGCVNDLSLQRLELYGGELCFRCHACHEQYGKE